MKGDEEEHVLRPGFQRSVSACSKNMPANPINILNTIFMLWSRTLRTRVRVRGLQLKEITIYMQQPVNFHKYWSNIGKLSLYLLYPIFDVIFNNDQFLLYFDPLRAEGPLRATEYVRCCKAQTESGFSPECKQRIVWQLASSVSYFFSFATLGLFDIGRKLRLRAELSGNSSRIQDIPENLFTGSNIVNAASDTLLIKLIKILEPPPAQCPSDDPPRPDVMTPLLECKNSLYILPQPEMDQLLFQAELDPSTYKGFYRIPDEKTMEIVPAAIAGYNAHFVYIVFKARFPKACTGLCRVWRLPALGIYIFSTGAKCVCSSH